MDSAKKTRSADEETFLDEVEKVHDLLVKSTGFADLKKPLSTNMTFSLLAEFYTILRQGSDRLTRELRQSVEEMKSRPAISYRGVFQETSTYRPGEVVTFGGSAWHCNAETTGVKPGGRAPTIWTLMVKRGRDARP
ncbi:MAG: hypothetical protein E5Y10_24960 [Mesorhizobium sp.]|uniref:hypothetical protein n=1 Tax=Mesorhizobium sp. TaxID=1871066 RepID=UPI00121D7DFA|nr:hypothetical protein [Mesorhizobium sp.]TIN38835.1 MAG: hypothetical protein E5Y13_15385 [Mesorhizobium sp.]TJU85673.1 MAG: hypothetical protein E5Y10_24960 [Mesorhizobium sp.]